MKTKGVCFAFSVLFLVAMPFSPVFGLGMGAATADSYIGEELSIHIPIFNVKRPNSLSVLLQRSEVDVGVVPLDAVVERVNSQLGIRVTSEQKTGEPYISFVLEIIDDGNLTSKEFTVLLDLEKPSSSTQSISQSGRSSLISSSNISSENLIGSSGDIMGPYEWAQAGRVPKSFGPVLDGQSLWRVARRINEALDVSVDQMMWSLYQHNRDQFSNGSIGSLKAGAILKIPTAEQASQISELQAKSNIENFDATQSERSLQSDVGGVAEVESSDDQNAKQKINADAQSFQLTGLNSSDNQDGQSSIVADGKSQDVIASLAEAVGSLTQELIKKDRKISFLEEKVAALEEYAEISAADLPNAKNDDLPADTTIELNEPVGEVLSENSQSGVVESESVDYAKETLSSSFSFKAWHWFVVILLVLLIAIFLFRRQLLDLLSSLNLFRDEEKIEFDPSEYHQADTQFSMPGHDSHDSELAADDSKKMNGLSQGSILDAIKSAVHVEDPLSPQTLMDLDGEFSYTEMLSENGDSLTVDETQLTFVERFDRALSKHDYGFALQLLNMAKENEIDEASYHYHRLRMYEAMHDEDAFYDYFCEVENDIPSFNSEMQTKISQLVLQMAQQ